MNPTPNRRRTPARTALVLAGACAGALLATAGPSLAADEGVTRSHSSGYPRCSATPPASLDQPPDGHGEANDADGTTYDTNWVFDADEGDEDVVWFRVEKANIQGSGNAVDANPSTGTSRRGSAWGEDRIRFTVDASQDQPGTIVVTNDIRIVAAWIVEGTGVNHAVMEGEALDIDGTVHRFSRIRAVDASLEAEMSEGTSATDQTWDTSDDATEGDSSTSSDSSGDRTTVRSSDSIERRVVSSTTDADEAEAEWSVERRFRSRECEVRIASAETIEVKAQAMVEDVETSAEVTQFDTVNIVEARYVVDAAPGDGTGSPGGSDPSGPTTPDGGEGTAPGTPEGTEPEEVDPKAPLKQEGTEVPPQEPTGPSLPDDGKGEEPGDLVDPPAADEPDPTDLGGETPSSGDAATTLGG